MKFGYHIIREMCEQHLALIKKHMFKTLSEFKGRSIRYFTAHADLVARQGEEREAKKVKHEREKDILSGAE